MTSHFPTTYYRFWLTLVCLAFLVTTAVGALSVAWLRHEASRKAQNCATLEKQIAKQIRDNATIEARVAQINSPQYLRDNAPYGLRPIADNQIVWLQSIPDVKSIEFEDAPVMLAVEETTQERNPFTVTFDLALLKTTE